MMNHVSYAGTYSLKYVSREWAIFYMNGKAIGGWRGRGGVYAAANHFGV